MAEFHHLDIDNCLKHFEVSREAGLSSKEAQTRQAAWGFNRIEGQKGKSPWLILFNQLKEVMVLILIGAALISVYLGEELDAIVILIIVVLNTVLGFWQEAKAEKAISALKNMSVPDVRVKRDGLVKVVPADKLVPGDIIQIEAGNIIPADARLLYAPNLMVQEAALTGESQPVGKSAGEILEVTTALADRKNMLYRGTMVTFGRGEAVITATGMQTEIGKIAVLLGEVEDEKTPLQKRLAKLGLVLAIAAFALILVVAGLSLLRGEDLKTTFLTAISMAVAAIPEGLPAVVTIALALGARKMLKKNALIRSLPSVETLGSVTVICSDKTGTLTQSRMTVTDIVTLEEHIHLDDIGRERQLMEKPAIMLLLAGGALCNDAVIEDGKMVGDPTEGALIQALGNINFSKPGLEQALPRVAELPFSPERKRMSTVHAVNKPLINFPDALDKNSLVVFVKGSVDGIMDISSGVLKEDRPAPLTDSIKEDILEHNHVMANYGIRVLGVAYKIIDRAQADDKAAYETGLTFTGMVGMIDPVRPEVKAAVDTCKTAGIRPIMITGDHPLTALYIAKSIGITGKDECLTGRELKLMPETKLKEAVKTVSVYARVSPEHKMRLVDALQSNGQIVSMTGDGVNDAPALKSADIGVAMGITGTDVSKQASDMVLLDDNFATIVEAVKQGRNIFDNIKKFIKYILTGNAGEIAVMLLGPFLGLPLPLLPIQILWINLVTDGAPGIALGYEPPENDVMHRAPYRPAEGLFARGAGAQILWTGLLIAILSLGVGLWEYARGAGGPAWQTMLFTTLTFCQMQYALCVRSYKQSFFTLNPFNNSFLLITVLVTLGLQIMLIYMPFFQTVFKTVALNAGQLALCFFASCIVVLAVEIEKLILRRFK